MNYQSVTSSLSRDGCLTGEPVMSLLAREAKQIWSRTQMLLWVVNYMPDFQTELYYGLLYIVACREVAMQRPRDGRIYQGGFWATAL
jgi:hypothetical protein